MQTFLPLADFHESARVLDHRRLGKQRIEAKQIVLALERAARGERTGWVNHPAVRMWRAHVPALLVYGQAMCVEWRARGFQDAQLLWFSERLELAGRPLVPSWLGDEAFHASHRAALLQKDPGWYSRFGWTDAWAGYVWPVSQ